MHADVAPPAQSGGHAYARGFPGGLLESARLTSRLGWFVYVAIAVGAALVYWGVAWSEGTLPSRAGVIHLALPTFAFVGLPALAWFNWLALRALSTARPLLTDDPAEQRSLERRLTTMPTRLVVGAGVLGLLALMLLTAFQPGDTYQRLQIFVTPVASVMEAVFQVMTWLGVGIGGVEIAPQAVGDRRHLPQSHRDQRPSGRVRCPMGRSPWVPGQTANTRRNARRERLGAAMSAKDPDETREGVALTNLDAELFDGAGATKRDLVDYLDAVSDRILPVLEDRPLSVVRVHRGQKAFMQKYVPSYTPAWVPTVKRWAEAS